MTLIRRVLQLAVLAVLTLGLATEASADSMRCGERLVSTGDSTLQVEGRCGPPASKRSRRAAVRVVDTSGNPAWVEVQIDEWVYSPGSHRFDQRLVFEDDKLVRVESGGYGK